MDLRYSGWRAPRAGCAAGLSLFGNAPYVGSQAISNRGRVWTIARRQAGRTSSATESGALSRPSGCSSFYSPRDGVIIGLEPWRFFFRLRSFFAAMDRMYSGWGAPRGDCSAGLSLFGNAPYVGTQAISNRGRVWTMARRQAGRTSSAIESGAPSRPSGCSSFYSPRDGFIIADEIEQFREGFGGPVRSGTVDRHC